MPCSSMASTFGGATDDVADARSHTHFALYTIARSWIVVAEGNEFLWPGSDLRKIPAADRYD